MKRTVIGPSGLRWTIRRLVVPTGMRSLTGPELLNVTMPSRQVVEGIDRRLPDAYGAWTGPYPLAFVFFPVLVLFLPFVLLARRQRWLPWTIEARSYPWGRRHPPIVFSYAVRGGAECVSALDELVVALARGDGRPELVGGEHVREPRSEFPPMHSRRGL